MPVVFSGFLLQGEFKMIKGSDCTAVRNGYVRILHEIKADYQPIDKSINIKMSPEREQNISLVGNHIILNGSEPVEIGTLISFKFDLKGKSRHRFGDYDTPADDNTFVGIGQVLNILESYSERYKMLIRLLDLKNM